MQIEAKSLTHTYMPGSPFSATAIRDVSFSIHQGEFIGIIGHTGSGKSTLVQHLNGLLRPTAGEIRVGGIPIPQKGGDMRAIRRMVGMVFQYPEYQLFEETVEKDVAFGPKNLGIEGEELEKRIRSSLSDVQLPFEEYGHRSPFELSGGEKRRAAIAGVLAMEPEVLVLDEPTAGLDPRSRKEMIELMRRWNDRGHTVIMISHSMEDVAKLCSRVLVMSHGELLMDGPPGQVFSRSDELTAHGLAIPQATLIAQMLRQQGFPLSQDIVSPKELEQEILSIWGGESHGI